jgi:membrane protease YdiL (CAAX protease family)
LIEGGDGDEISASAPTSPWQRADPARISPGAGVPVSPDSPWARAARPQRATDSASKRFRRGGRKAEPVTDPTLRRQLGIELVLVLAIFPLISIVSALDILVREIQSGHSLVDSSAIHNPWIIVGLRAGEDLVLLAVAGLVLYMLSRSGEGVRSINLDGQHRRMDAALVLPVFLLTTFAGMLLGHLLETAFHVHGFTNPDTHPDLPNVAYTVSAFTTSVATAVVEEVIVLGYLVRRLEQRALSTWLVIVICVVARVSYHLYYGWGAIAIAVWALFSVMVYLTVRRLWPFIVGHFIWDFTIFVSVVSHRVASVMMVVTFLVTLVMAIVWWRWSPAQDDEPDPPPSVAWG